MELKTEHGEEPTTGLKASLLLEMLPDQVQLTDAQDMGSKKLEYDTFKAKIKLTAHVQSDYPTSAHEHWRDAALRRGRERRGGRGALDVWRQPLCEIWKLTCPMYGSCWTCGGNHFSRECPKGDGGGIEGGDKNSGKAMKCVNCGGFGHRAAQCPTSVREIEYDEEEEGHGDVENVSGGWDIFSLEKGRRQQ